MRHEHLPSYTWNGRNTKAVQTLAKILEQWNVRNFSLIDLGPGGIAAKYASWLPEGDQTEIPLYLRAQRKLVNLFESGARDSDANRLVSFEVPQLINNLDHLGIERLFVIEKFKRILDATLSVNDPRIERVQCDVEKSRPVYSGQPVKGKVVVSLYVEERCEYDRPHARQVTLDMVEDEGYLLTSIPKKGFIHPEGFIQLRLEENEQDSYFGVFYKGERKDKRKKSVEYKMRAPGISDEDINRAMQAAANKDLGDREIKKDMPHTLFPNARKD